MTAYQPKGLASLKKNLYVRSSSGANHTVHHHGGWRELLLGLLTGILIMILTREEGRSVPKTTSEVEAERRWRTIGHQKLTIRRTLGWESDEALAVLRVLNAEIDRCLAIMSPRRVSK